MAERPSLAAGFLFPNAGGKDSFFMNLKMVFSVIGLFFGILMLSGFLSEAGLNTFLVLLIDAAVFILVFRIPYRNRYSTSRDCFAIFTLQGRNSLSLVL